ncbi:MAG: ParB N-terminal domain-containing protein [Thermoplasmata archaeon]|nr:ParB N-terminal domain-containing protein [Thermoplasmata archaeon]
MNGGVEFALLPIETLLEHEEIRPPHVERLRHEMLASGVVEVPILVARGSLVILNGHHRFAALKALGASRIPAYLIDYEGASVHLERWQPGPAITKRDVLDIARRGGRFPPKTTKHLVKVELPARPTRLEDLGVATPPGPRPTNH